MRDEAQFGYIDSAQTLVNLGAREWSQAELLRAAEAAELRNTGWPIGLVIHREGLRPEPTKDGIEARLRHYRETPPNWDDYWSFKKDGSYYVARLFEENFERVSYQSSEGHPEKPLWFDVRLWRIAEVVLHSAAIYRELAVPTTEPYVLSVNHVGLQGRELATSNIRRHIRRGQICKVSDVSWQREVSQDLVTSSLKSLVFGIASELFVLFDFFEISEEVVNDIVDQFLSSRL